MSIFLENIFYKNFKIFFSIFFNQLNFIPYIFYDLDIFWTRYFLSNLSHLYFTVCTLVLYSLYTCTVQSVHLYCTVCTLVLYSLYTCTVQSIVNQLAINCQLIVNQLSKNFYPSNPKLNLLILQILEANL